MALSSNSSSSVIGTDVTIVTNENSSNDISSSTLIYSVSEISYKPTIVGARTFLLFFNPSMKHSLPVTIHIYCHFRSRSPRVNFFLPWRMPGSIYDCTRTPWLRTQRQQYSLNCQIMTGSKSLFLLTLCFTDVLLFLRNASFLLPHHIFHLKDVCYLF